MVPGLTFISKLFTHSFEVNFSKAASLGLALDSYSVCVCLGLGGALLTECRLGAQLC